MGCLSSLYGRGQFVIGKETFVKIQISPSAVWHANYLISVVISQGYDHPKRVQDIRMRKNATRVTDYGRKNVVEEVHVTISNVRLHHFKCAH